MRGVPLGWLLGLTTVVIVVAVLAVATGWKQQWEIERGREDRQDLLAALLAPLAVDVERASTVDEIHERLRVFQEAHELRGQAGVRVALRDGARRIAVSPFFGPPPEPPAGALRAELPVTTRLLPGGHGRLEAWKDDSEFRRFVSRRWRLWGLTLAITAAVVLLSLQLAYQLLIARPLERLLAGVRQMEQGYWSGLELPRGAWELRWLAYRFRNLGNQLEETVRRLVDAERRALLGLSPASPLLPHAPAAAPGGEHGHDEVFRRKLVKRYLVARCRYLDGREPSDPRAREAARETWERDVVEAERLGYHALKSRLEDAALRLLEPARFEAVKRALEAFPAARKPWLSAREKELRKALGAHRVKLRGVQNRVKHVAGVFRKMRGKGLSLEQVHDVVAFRVLVTTEEECYRALAAVHERFEPLLLRFKDYIAQPKGNGYRSLHTCVRADDGVVFEVQVRTLAMHAAAEGGEAAHWRYKSGFAAEAERLKESFGGVLGRRPGRPRGERARRPAEPPAPPELPERASGGSG